jgi:putative inorganic carbon (hco3(-)) transporter
MSGRGRRTLDSPEAENQRMKSLVFTYLLTYGGALVSLFNPFVGLLIYVCFAIIKPDVIWFWSVPQGNYSRIVAVALLAGWVLNGCGNWAMGRARAIVLLLLAFLAWSAVCSVTAQDPQTAFLWVETLFKIVLPFLVGVTTIDSVGKLKALVWVIVLSQGFLAFELNLTYYEGNYNPMANTFGGMDNNCMGIAMNTCVALAFFLGLNTPAWWLRGLLFLLAMLMVHSILFSMSRGGMLGLIVAGAVSFLLMPKRPVYYLVALLGIAIALRLAGAEVRERFFSTFADKQQRDASADSRILLWSICIDYMKKSPIVGIGPKHFPLIAPGEYGLTVGKEGHTLWLQLGAEMGVVGLGILGLFYLLCTLRLLPLTRQSHPLPDPWLGHFARMVVASLAGFIVSAQFVSLIGLEVPYYVVLVGVGVLKLTTSLEAAVPCSEEWADANGPGRQWGWPEPYPLGS